MGKKIFQKCSCILAWLTLGTFLACGSEPGSTPPPPPPNQEFRVDSVYPGYNATMVPVNQPIVLSFSDEIDPSSLPASILFQETIGSASNNVSANLVASVNSNILTLISSQNFSTNASYTLTLLQSLKSLSGKPLWTLSVFHFFTGLNPNDSGGAVVDPTIPPYVSSVTNLSECYKRGFKLRFNEDLVHFPQVDYKIRQWVALGTNGISYSSGSAYVYPDTDMRTFIVDLGYDPHYEDFKMGFFIKVNAASSIDLTGNPMISDYPSSSSDLFQGYHYQINQIVTSCP